MSTPISSENNTNNDENVCMCIPFGFILGDSSYGRTRVYFVMHTYTGERDAFVNTYVLRVPAEYLCRVHVRFVTANQTPSKHNKTPSRCFPTVWITRVSDEKQNFRLNPRRERKPVLKSRTSTIIVYEWVLYLKRYFTIDIPIPSVTSRCAIARRRLVLHIAFIAEASAR